MKPIIELLICLTVELINNDSVPNGSVAKKASSSFSSTRCVKLALTTGRPVIVHRNKGRVQVTVMQSSFPPLFKFN